MTSCTRTPSAFVNPHQAGLFDDVVLDLLQQGSTVDAGLKVGCGIEGVHPAVLPPPEEQKEVTTAIGAARAKQSRRDTT